jgi:hypothetical protein
MHFDVDLPSTDEFGTTLGPLVFGIVVACVVLTLAIVAYRRVTAARSRK